MRTHKMIVGSPPLEMSQQLWRLLGRSPSAACQSCYSMSDSEIHSLDESGIESTRETQSLQGSREFCQCPKAHQVCDPHQLALPVAFFHLAVDQACRHLPLAHFPPSMKRYEPLSKMGCQGIEVHIETIT